MLDPTRMAKVDIQEACTELREVSKTDDGDVGERNEDRRGCHQGILVEVPCKGQSTSECKTEDSSPHSAVSKVIDGQYAISQRVSLILLLTGKRVRSTVHGVPTPSPLDNLRDEVNAITRWWSKSFFHLIRCFAGRTGGAEYCRKKANKLLVAFPTRLHLAKASYADYCTMCMRERVDN